MSQEVFWPPFSSGVERRETEPSGDWIDIKNKQTISRKVRSNYFKEK